MTADPHFIGFGLHEAVLEQMVVDWPNATATLSLSAVVPKQERVVITARGVVELTCPRRQPWGASDGVFYVSDVRLLEADKRLELEMASGDVLIVVAANFEKRPGE